MCRKFLTLNFTILFIVSLWIPLVSAEKSNLIGIDGTPDYNKRIEDITNYFARKFNITKGEDIHILFKSKSVKSIVAKPYSIGDKREFWVQDDWKASNKIDDDGDGQVDEFDESMYKINATLMRIGSHCYVFVEDGQSVDDNVLDNIVREFDNVVYPNVTNTFGNPPDIDNDPKIIILLLDIRDANYYGLSRLFIDGYFWRFNEYPNNILPEGYSNYSNEAEIIYIDTNPGDPSDYSTLAHEFQHMVHFNGDIDEETWIDEGCALYAEFICGYGHDWEKINEYRNFYNNSLTIWEDQGEDKVLADYGASYLFILYLSEKYGDLSGNPVHKHFIRDLVDEDANGIGGINKVLSRHGYPVRFEDVFKNWVIANYLDIYNPSNPLWRYDGLDIQVSITGVKDFTGQPTSYSDSVNKWAADYIKINPQADTLYFENDQNFWIASIRKAGTGSVIRSASLEVANESSQETYRKIISEAGLNISNYSFEQMHASTIASNTVITPNNTITDADAYDEIVIVVSPLDREGSYTLTLDEVQKKQNSLQQGESALYVIPKEGNQKELKNY